MTTRDGFYFDNKTSKLHSGLKCKGAVDPSSNTANTRTQFDAIVIGAGYAGLTACRDLCVAGFNVLLIEARDRIGGRTFTTEVDGHLYEMGGTWVHWNQPHTFREMSRYGLTELLPSHEHAPGYDYCTTVLNGMCHNVDKATAHDMTEKAFRKLCDIDGHQARSTIPYPHNPHFNTAAAKDWEKVSLAQRLSDIKPALTDSELAILKARLFSITGGDFEKASFFDVLRWWALGGYTMDGLYETGDDFKLPRGQSDFARCFFEEACQTGKLSTEFGTAVESVQDDKGSVLVNGKWRAKRVICTIPLNVLKDVHFEPPLSEKKTEAAGFGNVNLGAKFHLEVSGAVHRAWSSAMYPVTRACSASGDGLTPAGNSHLVCFGSNKDFDSPEEDAKSFVEDVKKSHEMDVLKTVWHDWSKDPFAKGSWCMYPPEFSFRYLSALQERAGNVSFANSDWASGWRGFIDGAIEQGMLAARNVSKELRTSREAP